MQVLLGYAFDRDPDATEVPARLAWVEEHYATLWRGPVVRRGVDAHRIGLYLWDAARSRSRWPAWQQDGDFAVATIYLPFGYERVVGDIQPEGAAVPIATALEERPWSVLDMTAPFVVASLDVDRGRLRLHTDGIGLGRLFELRFPGGWVWSNRPAAATRFARIRAQSDRDGWRTFAATGWFQGDRSPVSRVFAVPAGATIGFDEHGAGRTQSRVDALAAWSAHHHSDALAPERVDAVADALREFAGSLGRMWPGPIVADLSGGRDSRLVLAAALAAGLDVQVRTNGSLTGEAELAERLVAALPAEAAGRVMHQVFRPQPGRAPTNGAAALKNALAWHRNQEGLRPATYLPMSAPDGLAPAPGIHVGGAAGEIAHGHFYPTDFSEISGMSWADRLDAFADRLATIVVRRPGISALAREAATAQIRRTLDAASVAGLDDAKMLDYFYAAERLRRWGTTAEYTGTVTPLLVPEFIRAAFDLTPEQRGMDALHRAVTGRLVPEWRDAPYYRRPQHVVPPAALPRLGIAVDRDLISGVVADHTPWGDGYDPRAVAGSWSLLLQGRGGPDDERLLQRVIWRAVFEDYLHEVNGEKVPERVRSAEPLHPIPRETSGTMRRFAARGLRRVARAIDPPGLSNG